MSRGPSSISKVLESGGWLRGEKPLPDGIIHFERGFGSPKIGDFAQFSEESGRLGRASHVTALRQQTEQVRRVTAMPGPFEFPPLRFQPRS